MDAYYMITAFHQPRVHVLTERQKHGKVRRIVVGKGISLQFLAIQTDHQAIRNGAKVVPHTEETQLQLSCNPFRCIGCTLYSCGNACSQKIVSLRWQGSCKMLHGRSTETPSATS
jgi:hypothetical protein